MNETLQTLGIPFFLILSFLLGYLIAYFAGRSKAAKWMEGSTAVEGKIENLTRQLNQALEEHQKSDQELEDISAHFEKIKAEYNRTKVVVNPNAEGPYNLVAPEPATCEQIFAALGKELKRPNLIRIPAWAMRLAAGSAADQILLTSHRMSAEKLLATGFQFNHPTLSQAASYTVR